MNLEETVKLMGILAIEYGDKFKLSEDRAEMWHAIIGHHSLTEALLAVRVYLSTPQAFPPTVGQINGLIIEARTGAKGTDWGEEWNKVLRAAANSSYGAEHELAKLSPRTQRAIGGIAGLKELGMAEISSHPTYRAQFRQRYEAAVSTEANSEVLKDLLTTDNKNKRLLQ